jgi:hypothetical protein
MPISFSQLFAANQIDNVAVETLFTVPASPTTSLARNVRVRFANTTALAATIIAYAVPPAGTAGATNVCLPTVSILANSYIDVDIPTMVAGAFLQAQAGTATSITATCLDGFIQT